MDSISDIDTFLSVMDFGHTNPLKIIDIGAHSGKFTQAVKDRYPAAKSFMFEPNPERFEYLVTNFPDDFVFSYGVANERKKSKFVCYGFDLSQLNRVTASEQVENGNALIEIQLVSLDGIHHSILNNLNIDICKIDTEGQELNVLKGAHEMLSKKAISYIIFECGSTYTSLGYKVGDVIALLNQYGYDVYNGKHKLTPDFNDYSLADYLATYKPIL